MQQYLFSGLFERFFIYFLLTAKRYPFLWFWGFIDFILKHFWCLLSFWGLQNTESNTSIYSINKRTNGRLVSRIYFGEISHSHTCHKMFELELKIK